MIKYLFLFGFLLFSCNKETKEIDKIENKKVTPQEAVTQLGETYGYNVIKNPDNSFGYQIYKDGTKVIKQEYIPAIPGNHGFETEKQAKSLAELVIKKLENQIMPPTVSVEEVDSIRAIK